MPAMSKTDGRPSESADGDLFVITTQAQKWRFKCPNAPFHHDDWRLWNGIFCCRSCQRLRDNGHHDVETTFDELWDAQEKQLVPRARIRVRE